MSLEFRLLTSGDLPLLAEWLSRPHVRETEWGIHSPTEVDADFGMSIHGDERANLWLFVEDAKPTGMIQDYVLGDNPEWLSDLRDVGPDPSAIGIDYLIGEPDRIGMGLGSRMITDFVGTSGSEIPNHRKYWLRSMSATVVRGARLRRPGFVESGPVSSRQI